MKRFSTAQLAVATLVLVAVTWLVATNFIRVELRLFAVDVVIRLGWALAIALAVGIAVGVWFGRSTRRRR